MITHHPPYPSLYEINTRVWLRRFDQPSRPRATLADVPNTYWDALAARGINCVWLMGVWQVVETAVPRYCLTELLVREYRAALPDWAPEDTIGSPYAIDTYTVSASLGTQADLLAIRRALHERGMMLVLDFVPNHFHAESSLIDRLPALFLSASEEDLARDPSTFYRTSSGRVLAHGKDPYFAAWQDTAQVNYSHPAARQFMADTLLVLAELCDGVRCDMAMLPLLPVFRQTWGTVLPAVSGSEAEFWPAAIQAVKAQHPQFCFIAEVYWDKEWDLQQQGFDYTYDKRLCDRLLHSSPQSVKDHLLAEQGYQGRLVRFLENHDEARIASRLHARRAEAAALIAYTIPGMRFFYDGQWEGQRVRVPVQLGREPRETPCACTRFGALAPVGSIGDGVLVCPCTKVFYERLLALLALPIFRSGIWALRHIYTDVGSLLAWEWVRGEDFALVFVNYGDDTAVGRFTFDPEDRCEGLRDAFSGHLYPLDSNRQLHLRLAGWEGLVLLNT